MGYDKLKSVRHTKKIKDVVQINFAQNVSIQNIPVKYFLSLTTDPMFHIPIVILIVLLL